MAVGTSISNITAWHLYTLTYNNNTLTGYVDGVSISAAAINGTITASVNPITIGRDGSLARYLNGSIDDVRVYNTALTPDQVQAIYKEGAR